MNTEIIHKLVNQTVLLHIANDSDEYVAQNLIDHLFYSYFKESFTNNNIQQERSQTLDLDQYVFRLQKRFELKKRIFCLYTQEWRKVNSEEISSQHYFKLILVLLTKFGGNKDPRDLNTALKIISYLKKKETENPDVLELSDAANILLNEL